MRRVAAAFVLFFGLAFSAPAMAALGASVTLAGGQPGTILPGQLTAFEITLSNDNQTSAISNVDYNAILANVLPGALPNGLKVAGAPTYTCDDPVSGVAPGVGVLTATIGTQVIGLTGGVIPQASATESGTCSIIVPVTAGTSTGAATGYTYLIPTGAITGDDGAAVANSGNVNQSVNVSAMNRPVVSKSFGGNNNLVLGGAPTTMSITITNNNAVAVTNVDLTDTFPLLGAGGALIKVSGAVTPTTTSTCTGAGVPFTFTPAIGDIAISATDATIAANGSCTISVEVDARHTNNVYQTGTVNNTIAAGDVTTDVGLAPVAVNVPVRTRSPLRTAKAFDHNFVSDGQTDGFTVTLFNDGTTPLVINSLTDDPIDDPDIIGGNTFGLDLTADPTVTCTGAGVAGTFTRTAGNSGFTLATPTTIAAGGSCTIDGTFTATVQTPNVPISYTNSIVQGAIGNGAGVVSQSASAAILVIQNLYGRKTVTPATAAAGSPVRYTVTIENWSNAALTGATAVSVSDALPSSQTFLTGIIGGIDYTTTSGAGCGAGVTSPSLTGAAVPTFNLDSVPARVDANTPGTCSFSFSAMTNTAAATGNPYSNTLAPGSVCYDNGGTPVCNGSPPPSIPSGSIVSVLTATKAFTPAGPSSEGTITRMRVTINNNSVNTLTNMVLADTLPTAVSGGQMRVATPPNAATTCGAGVITAVANSTSVAMNAGTVPARAGGGTGAAGTCFVEVDIVGGAGAYTNTATVSGTQTYADGSSAAVGPVSPVASITFLSALTATKSFNPPSVSSGGESTVTVRLSNGGAVALSGISVTDPLPPGMVLATPPNAYTTCAGSTSFTAVAGASSVSMSGADLAGNGTCDMLFDVVATGGANWVNTIPIGNITASGGVSNQTAVSGTLVNDPPTNLTISKATNPSTLTFPGQVSQLTITIVNGTAAVTGMSLTDYFTVDGTSGAALNGMTVAPTPAASTTCTGGIVSAAPGGTSVTLSGASMAASATCTITVNVSSSSVGGITNFIPPGSIDTDQGLTNAVQATTSLTTQSNVGITKQFTPNVVAVGQRSRLRITLYNPTAQPASGVNVTDNLPANVTVPAGPNAVTTCAGATITAPTASSVQISGGNISAASGGVAASCYGEIDVVAGVEGDFTNTIPASSITATIGGAPATNSQPTSDILRAKSPIVIHKAIDSFTLDAGNPAGFTTGGATRAPGVSAVLTINIANPNSAPLTSASFTDTLPSGLVVGLVPGVGTTCAGASVTAPASSTTIGVTGATIPAGGSCNVTVNVLSNTSGVYTNTIPASAITTFEGVTNDEPTSAEITVSTPPTVAKSFTLAVIPPNGTSTMTIFLGNDNASAVTLTSLFTDNLPTAPGNVLVAPVPNVVKTCPGAVTAVAGSGTVSYANGAQVPAGGCTISVDVTAATPGVHTNNIPAGRLTTNFGNNQQPANGTLTVSSLGFIAGKVFQDNNVTPNGSFETGTDDLLSGVSIELHAGATCGGALLDTQLTDSLGNYLFSGLAAGTYSVCEPVQPTGTTNGITTAGPISTVNGSTGTAGTASNPTATSSQIVNIILNGDGAGGEISGSANNNFAEVVLSSISGVVFRDLNNNGVQNGTDTGINGVTVELLDAGNVFITSVLTDAFGNYTFPNLQPGTYSVREPTQPTGTSNGLTVPGAVGNGGTAGTATNVLTLPSVISTIILPPNTASTLNNFAEIPNSRSISGTVFLDYDNNGLLDGGDYGLSNQTINLTGTDINGNPVTDTTTTLSDGTYSFNDLPAGTYTVDQPVPQPTGTTNGITTAGPVGGVASNPTASSSQILNIPLTGANTVSGGNDFAEVPGAAPDLTITKGHTPASFGEGSDTGYFNITPANIGAVDTSGTVTIVDTLPAGMTVAAPATGTGWSCVGAIGASTVTCTSTDVITGGGGLGQPITLRVAVDPGTAGQLLTNTAVVSGGGEPPGFDGNNTDTDTVAISTTANVSGTIWRDYDHDRIIGGAEPRVPGWDVELLLNGVLVRTVATDALGAYAFTGLSPGSGYSIQFREPTTGIVYGRAVPNEQGIAPNNGTRDTGGTTVNPGTNAGNPAGADISSGDGTLSNLTLLAGDNIIEQSLPLDPAGVVYDSVTRNPVAGAEVTITGPPGFTPAIHVVGGTNVVVTAPDGIYQFLLTAAAPVGTYTLTITTYPGGYVPLPSTIIPVCANPVVVSPPPPDPALVQTTPLAPIAGTPAHNPAACPASSAAFTPADQASTQHYFQFDINPATSANIVNNHIPLDPVLGGALVLTKSTPMTNVSVGQLVPYIITARNTLAAALSNIDIIDTIPPGFKFKVGSATIDGVPIAPVVTGRNLNFANLTLLAGATREIRLMLVVGTGVQPGEYVNRAQAFNNLVVPPTPNAVSNLATATVRVVPDPIFDCTDLIGKVFDDKNANGYQDDGEPGIAAVRVATVNGLLVTTDAEGRFHIACADIPDADRGSNFVMKLDERTLPTGYRVTTENPRIIRITRGKMAKLNFGAAIHKVIRIDMRDAAFEHGTVKLLPAWQQQIEALPEKLRSRPGVLRISYVVGLEDPKLARDRLKTVSAQLRKLWEKSKCCHELQIEEEFVLRAKGGVK